MVGWLGNGLGHWEGGFSFRMCTSEDVGDRLVTVHLGKWMKEQNVITAGHCWEQSVCLVGQVKVLKIGFMLRLWTVRIQVCYPV